MREVEREHWAGEVSRSGIELGARGLVNFGLAAQTESARPESLEFETVQVHVAELHGQRFP